MKMHNIKFIHRIMLLAALCLPAAPALAKQQIKFGIVPQSSGSKLAQTWTPILSYLEEKTGYEIRFATARNIPTFEQRLHDGKYDIAYMNPTHYTAVHGTSGYEAFARARDVRLKGIIVVHKDSPYRELKDLTGGEIAFPSKSAFAASQIPLAVFNQLGVGISPMYVASHDSVYRNVAKGRYQAGGGVMRTFNNTPADVRKDLRVLWTSDDYTPHAFAAHPRVDRAAVERLQQAMLDMEHDPRGQALLKAMRMKGFEVGMDRDWNDVRSLDISN